MNSLWMATCRATAVSTLAVCLVGCTSPMLVSERATEGAQGIVYSLPKAQVELKVSRRLVAGKDVEDAQKALEAAIAASSKAEEELVKATAAKKLADRRNAEASAADINAEAKAQFAKEKGRADILATLAKADATKAAADLLIAKSNHKALDGSLSKCLESGSLTLLPPVPDVNHRYVAMHRTNDFRDDVLNITVSNGLLSSGEATGTGQAGTVIVNLIKSIAGISTSNGVTISRAASEGPSTAPECNAFDATQVFDPTDWAELNRAQLALQTARASFRLEAWPEPKPKPGAETKWQNAANEQSSLAPREGLAYRTLRPIELTLRKIVPDGERPDEKSRVYGLIPDSSATYVLPVNATAWSKSTTKHVFKDGTPTQMSIDRQNPAAAIASLPIDMLKALVSVPAELIKLRVDYSSQQTALTEQQVKMLEAQLALIKAQQDLDAAKKDSSP